MSPIRGCTEPATVGGSVAPVREIPELRSSPSPIQVKLGRSARATISGDLFHSTRTDALESGGFLFSRPTRTWEKRVELLFATRTGEAQRGSDSLSLDIEMWRSAEAAFANDGLDLELGGLWHCHPDTRSGEPSSADLRALLGVLDWHEQHGRSRACAIGLIYTASPYLGDSWARPQLHCWVVRREGQGRWARAVCEPGSVNG
jgi:hypothetical protein